MIYAFYSYEHRVGRSMALANVAELFYRQGLKVLIVDCDLQSPGLESFFFTKDAAQEVWSKPGVIDLLWDYKRSVSQPLPNDVQNEGMTSPLGSIVDYLLSIRRPGIEGGSLCILPAGRRDENYAKRVKEFDWHDFMQNWEGELFFRWFRNRLKQVADVVLIDLHAGEIEPDNVYVSQVADGVIMLCAVSERSIVGTYNIALGLTDEKMVSRIGHPLAMLIVPARIEYAEKLLLEKFSAEFHSRFTGFMCPPVFESSSGDLFNKLAIPYIAFYEYSRELAVDKQFIGNYMFEAFHNIATMMKQLVEYDRDSSQYEDKRKWDEEHALERFRKLRERMTENPSIFISYAREDEEKVHTLYTRLRDAGFKPWLDKEDLLAGQDWRAVIEDRINKSDFVIVCISNYSTRKRGFVQQETVWALDVVQSMPEGRVYLIPVLLEECEIPKRLGNWHCVSLFDENGFEKLEKAIRFAIRSEGNP